MTEFNPCKSDDEGRMSYAGTAPTELAMRSQSVQAQLVSGESSAHRKNAVSRVKKV